jgi:hypothetical protein
MLTALSTAVLGGVFRLLESWGVAWLSRCPAAPACWCPTHTCPAVVCPALTCGSGAGAVCPASGPLGEFGLALGCAALLLGVIVGGSVGFLCGAVACPRQRAGRLAVAPPPPTPIEAVEDLIVGTPVPAGLGPDVIALGAEQAARFRRGHGGRSGTTSGGPGYLSPR